MFKHSLTAHIWWEMMFFLQSESSRWVSEWETKKEQALSARWYVWIKKETKNIGGNKLNIKKNNNGGMLGQHHCFESKRETDIRTVENRRRQDNIGWYMCIHTISFIPVLDVYTWRERERNGRKNKQTRSNTEIHLPSIKPLIYAFSSRCLICLFFFGAISRQLRRCNAVIIRMHFCSHLRSNQI